MNNRSKAQEFAQLRNSRGGLLKGIIKNLDHNVKQACTSREKRKLNKAVAELGSIYNDWSDNYEQAKSEHL